MSTKTKAKLSPGVMEATCMALRELQSHRIATVKMMLRINNQARALARRHLGWTPDGADREKINKQAETIVNGILDGTETNAPPALQAYVMNSAEACRPFENMRSSLESQMKKLARSLPVYEWVKSVLGFGDLGLAIIVGECGNLSNYDCPAKVWKRMGVAVIDGERQRKSAEDFAIHGYNPRRRSAMWTIGDSMLKNKGSEYYEVFEERLHYEIEKAAGTELEKTICSRGMKTNKKGVEYESFSAHARARAQRFMEKRLLKDLWNAWREV
jgi:hypothetical protein